METTDAVTYPQTDSKKHLQPPVNTIHTRQKKIVTMDECWIYYYDIETKIQSKYLIQQGTSPSKKVNLQQGKSWYTTLMTTITGAFYATLFRNYVV